MSYIVKSGDTLSQIASQNGISLSQLLALNPQYQTNPNLIRPGESVNITPTSSAPSLPTVSQSNSQFAQSNPQYGYSGQSNPTTPIINVTGTVSSLRQQMSNGSITPSQASAMLQAELTSQIKNQTSGSRGSQVSGDSDAAASQAMTQLFAPMTINDNGKISNLNSNGTLTTQSTTVNKSVTGGAGTTSSTAYSTPGANGTYSVQSGDTLSKIASDNGLTTQQIISLNPQITNPDLINPGQAINLGTNASTPTNNAPTNQGGSNGLPSTGNPALDDLQNGFAGIISGSLAQGFTINPALSITPDTLKQFITETAGQLEPRYQQILSQEKIGIDQSVNALAVDYLNKQGQTEQDFKQSLGTLRDQSTMGGGGERALELGLTNSANRSLSSLDTQTALQIGQKLQEGGQASGQGIFQPLLQGTGYAPFADQNLNASGFNIPSLYGRTLSNQGGDSVFAGSGNQGNALNFNYDPSLYKYGTIPGNFSTDFSNLLNQTASNYQQGMTATGATNQIKSTSGLSL